MNIQNTEGKKRQVRKGLSIHFDATQNEELFEWVMGRIRDEEYPDHRKVADYDSKQRMIWVEDCPIAVPAAYCVAL